VKLDFQPTKMDQNVLGSHSLPRPTRNLS